MDQIKEWISSIDINSLLKIFDIQIAIAVLVFFFVFRSVFAKIIIKIYYNIIKSKKDPKDSSMYKHFKIMFVLIGIYCMIKILPTNEQVLYVMNKIYKLVVLYYILKIFTGLIDSDSVFLQRFFKDPTNKTVNTFICKVVRAIVWITYFFILISELGYDLSGLVTALGLGAAAISLAAQDLVKSLISGVTILTDKPFVIGDWIEVGEYQGSVIDISFRSVRIKTANNSVITIPNSTITSTYVINWNRLTSRRLDLTLNLSLETTSEKIKKIVKEIKLILENNPMVIKETVQVYFDTISSCSSDIKIFLYIREPNYIKFLKIKEEILCSLLFLAEKENIDLAYPTQTLYVKRKEEVEE